MRDRAVVAAEIERLRKTRASGVSRVRHGEREVTYANIDALDQAIASAEAELASIDAGAVSSGPPAFSRLRSRGRGL